MYALHCKVSAAEKLLSIWVCSHGLVPAYINRIIAVAWCFGQGILLTGGDSGEIAWFLTNVSLTRPKWRGVSFAILAPAFWPLNAATFLIDGIASFKIARPLACNVIHNFI